MKLISPCIHFLNRSFSLESYPLRGCFLWQASLFTSRQSLFKTYFTGPLLTIILILISSLYIQAQSFIQLKNNAVNEKFKGGVLLEGVFYNISGKLTSVALEVAVLDSSFNEVTVFNTPYFIVKDTFNLEQLKFRVSWLTKETDLSGHKRFFLMYRVRPADDQENVEELLFELRTVEPEKKELPVPKLNVPDQSPVKISGSVTAEYQYFSEPMQGQTGPNHQFNTSIDPKISLWGIPLNGNVKFNSLSLDGYKKMTFANFQLDTDQLKKNIKNIDRQELAEKAEQIARKILKDKLDSLVRESDKLEEEIRKKLDTSVNLPDSSALADSLGLSDSLIVKYMDSLHRAAEVVDSLQKVQKKIVDGIAAVRAIMDQRGFPVVPDSLSGIDTLNPISRKGLNPISLLKKMTNVEKFQVGLIYPELPSIIGGNASLNGFELKVSKGIFGHRFSMGRINYLSASNINVESFQYTGTIKFKENNEITATAIANRSFSVFNKGVKIQNPIFSLGIKRNFILKNFHILFFGDAALSRFESSENTLQNTVAPGLIKEENTPEKFNLPVMLGQVFNGLSAKVGFKGGLTKTGTLFQLSFEERNQGFFTVFNPFQLPSLKIWEATVSQSLFKKRLLLSATQKIGKETSANRDYNQGTYSLQFKPRRGPHFTARLMDFQRNFEGSRLQKVTTYSLNISYQKKLFQIPHIMMLTGTYQENLFTGVSSLKTKIVQFTDQVQVKKNLTASFSAQTIHTQNSFISMLTRSIDAKVFWELNKIVRIIGGAGLASNGNTTRGTITAGSNFMVKKYVFGFCYTNNYFHNDYTGSIWNDDAMHNLRIQLSYSF